MRHIATWAAATAITLAVGYLAALENAGLRL